jgi:hypothetical protein
LALHPTALCFGVIFRKKNPFQSLQPSLPQPAAKGKHLQLFKMRRKVGKGFYSTAPDAPDGQ